METLDYGYERDPDITNLQIYVCMGVWVCASVGFRVCEVPRAKGFRDFSKRNREERTTEKMQEKQKRNSVRKSR